MINYIIVLLLLGVLAKLFIPDFGKQFGKTKKSQKLILDSCALIDGRILDLSQSGLLTSDLVVPDFVVHELQLLADGADARKRERARYGLEVIKDLQALNNSKLSVNSNTMQGNLPTDDKLVVLAKRLNAQLYTTDFNLQKVAEIGGITVLNVNDLAQKLRPIALPGEKKILKLIQKGNSPKQGVGYLEDGTMLVVENGARALGKVVEVEVTGMHQTVSGKMLFGDLVRIQNSAPKPTLSVRPVTSRFKAPSKH